ncbi:hypothetical protein VOLCADRAFT_89329 [Volvox carteri f. nagariensis]|uniref:Cationic amino acid transporter C-terminal domain-containing protein n=1 Tax=Volvox carteri f. nagariensis TaxID=3068 RepID=D8TRF2_VOLCA|nr:uncharacterized protein VOLCADRAFT_89329 [Volvox carteri f. nagariensis]EFJ49983.1 hypothetical protein VOLCADRAFT_89329 [Volvox carteri f. nagariensis]|eukprot:XP_002949048.1 hypothetical protein VOLCADRAFT_89329 [Volvox carteri f. nagariensis]
MAGRFSEFSNALLTRSAWGFSPREYLALLPQYPELVYKRVFKTKSAQDMALDAQAKGPLKRTLGVTGLTCVGVGLMLGAGIFIAPGTISVDMTGPAVCISYLIASISAFLSCFCYSEFAVDMPLAGAAYTNAYRYTYKWSCARYTFARCILQHNMTAMDTRRVVVSNLLFEYILADAAVIRGFSPYFAVLIGKDSGYFRYTTVLRGKAYVMDWWAFALTLLTSGLLALGAKESIIINTVITIIHIVVMIFIIIAGFVKADSANFRPFFPNDQPDQWKQVFNGASIAFFSFIGFDAVATAAEEVIDPATVMPQGILGSLGIVTVIYFLMCVVLSLMVPRADIDTDATFAKAFEYVGLGWAKHIVALGAILGILTGIMMGIYAPARILVSCCREAMLPPFMAWVGPRATPWVATWLIGISVAVIALLTGFDELANMVSIGTFVVFWFVAVALIWRRMHAPGKTTLLRWANELVHIFAMIGFSLGFVLVWTLPVYNTDTDGVAGKWKDQQYKWLIAMAVLCAATPLSMFLFCKPAYVPSGYKVPLYPLVPCASIFVNTFLLGQLDQASYERCVCALAYGVSL